ncbi:10284_t:CDS:2 [Funneliformis geosporum]|uniref:10284_t:CDS:1 n=1 Tax=Funneliformis geosporum TaxID=1117311 RepID=A0A9W4SBM8_9GLOM|nr:10284_t:CDS:2 [Funneliformis geosporum]
MSESEMIRQNPEQSVSDYAQKIITPIIVSHSLQSLNAAITKAKEIETRFTIIQPI